MEASTTTESVKEYYGKTLQKTEDLKTNACLTGERPASYLREALSSVKRNYNFFSAKKIISIFIYLFFSLKVHDDITARYYGCGFVVLKFTKLLFSNFTPESAFRSLSKAQQYLILVLDRGVTALHCRSLSVPKAILLEAIFLLHHRIYRSILNRHLQLT